MLKYGPCKNGEYNFPPHLNLQNAVSADFTTTATYMKDSRYFKHDANARHDPKIKAMMNKYGIEGYGRYWVIVEMMREASHYRLEDKPYLWSSMAEEMKCGSDEAKAFMDDCTENYCLFEKDEKKGVYISMSLLHRMIQLDQVREARAEAAKASWKKRKESEDY